MNNLPGASQQEKLNFIKFVCKNIDASLSVFIFVFKKIFRKLKQNLKFGCYPGYALETLKDKGGESVIVRWPLNYKRTVPGNKGGTDNNDIELLYSNLDFNNINDYFSFPFDEEELSVFCRFNWLLTKLSGSPGLSQEWGLEKVRKCLELEKELAGKNKFHLSAYDASERIVNSLIFFLLASGREESELPDWLKGFISDSAEQISNKLEFYPEGRVNNHIINDARGLYFAGAFLGKENYSNAAISIFRNELSKVITEDGFLREGSSHYHFLITRWLLEVIFLADLIDDSSVKSIIRPFAAKCVKVCWFFLVREIKTGRWGIPLIGDVSPDFPPKWLLGLPWSEPAISVYRPLELPRNNFLEGWGSLFGFSNELLDQSLAKEKCFQPYNSGWYRLDFYRFTIFWHVDLNGPSLNTTHGHSDTGSFCFYVDGMPVLADIGRYNYTNSSIGKYGISAASHNAIMIDGLEPFGPANYPDYYISSSANVNYKEEGERFIFKISHNGFNRISGDKINIQREYIIEKNLIQVIDNLDGKKQHNIEQSFHFYPGMEIVKESKRDDIYCLRFKGIRLNFKVDDFKIRDGFIKYGLERYFPAYGRQAASSVIRVSGKQKLPFSQKFTFEVL